MARAARGEGVKRMRKRVREEWKMGISGRKKAMIVKWQCNWNIMHG